MRFLKAVLWPINWLLTVMYLQRRRVVWKGKVPSMNMLRPPIFQVQGKLTVGIGVIFFTHQGRTVIQVDPGAEITIGNHVRIGSGTTIRAGVKIRIDDYVLIGRLVDIYDWDLHKIDEQDECVRQEVVLMRNTWIGVKSTILPGVVIGKHSVVGANSVVTKHVKEKTKVAGTPAHPVGIVDCRDHWIRLHDPAHGVEFVDGQV